MKDAGVEAAEGSVTNREDVANAVKNVSAVYHLAGKVSRDNEDAAAMNKIHVEGTRILCEAAKEAGVKTFVLASSSGTIAVSAKPKKFWTKLTRRRLRLFRAGLITLQSFTRKEPRSKISTAKA